MCPIRIVLPYQRDALVGQVAHVAFLSHLLVSLAKKLETFVKQYQNTEVRKLEYSDSSGYLISAFRKTLYSRGTSIYVNIKVPVQFKLKFSVQLEVFTKCMQIDLSYSQSVFYVKSVGRILIEIFNNFVYIN